MKRKLIYSAATLMALASPIFAQTPGGGGGGSDLKLPLPISRWGSRPAFAAWAKESSPVQLAKLPHGTLEHKRASGSHSFSDSFLSSRWRCTRL